MKLDGRLLRQARAARVDLALTVGAGLMGGVVIVAQALLLSRVVSQVFLAPKLGSASLGEVREPLLALLLLSLGRAGLAWGGEVAAGRVASRVKAGLRQQLAAHLLALGPGYTRGERSGELANTVVEGIEALDAYFRQYLPQLALAALVPLTVLVVVFPLDWVSGLVLLLTAPLIPVFMVLIGHVTDALTRRQWTALSRMSAHFLDVLQGLTTLKLLGRSREQVRTIAQVGDRYRTATMGVLRVAFLSALVLEMVATISTALVAVQIGLRLLYGHLSFEQGFFVLLLAPEFYLPLRLLGARFHTGMAGTAAAQRIFAMLETVADGTGAAGMGEEDVPAPPLGISFSDVQYAYEAGRRAALQGFSLQVASGETVALVGPSGAGKSTVAHLLLRFAAPDRGAIAVNGRPLGELPPAAWRAQVAWVPQHPYLFHDTVLNNVRLARPHASREQVIHAARQAHAHDFIVALPQGYDTVVGERGARLSGGQAQRIALARAFLQDAPLLVLDEATANLDPEVEDLVQEAMARLLPGRTALVIAHRLGTVTRADRIVVLDGGRVVQAGRHADLVQQEGLYRQLVSAYAGDGAPQPIAWGADDGGAAAPPRPAPTATAQAGREPQETGSPWHTCKRLLELAAPFAPRMALAALLGLATIGSGIGLMTTSGYLIARAAQQPSIAALQVAIVGVRFFGIARGVFRYLERYVSHDTTFRLLARLRVWFYGALEPLAPARLMQYRSGDLLARIVADVETLENVYLRVLAPPLVAVLVALLAGVLLGRFEARLAAVLLAFMLLAGAGLPLLTRALGHAPGRRLVQVRAALNATLVDGIQGLADLLASGGEADHLARVRALSRELGTLQERMACISGLHGALAGLLMNLATLSVLAVAIPLVTGGTLPGVYLAALVLAAISSFEAVLPLPQAFQDLETSLAAAARLFEIVDAAPAVCDPPAPVAAPGTFDLRVQDVRFAYAAAVPRAVALGTAAALDGVSLDLPLGAQVAVVGPSGAGKSTLAHLLLRFWDYQGGRILLDGQELRRYAQADVRRGIAVVSQHTHLFNGTVRENLLLARPAATEADLVAATRQAQLHEFVVSLPQGYDTWIGEGGQHLSGGQRQCLAIARALLQDAPLLLLDEPAAHLDALTERALLAALRAVMAGRTTLTITHRLAGLAAADEILVLRAGRVVERGRHDELLRRGGLYRHMWELQHQVLEKVR